MSMKYDVLILPNLFDGVPPKLKDNLKKEIKGLSNPFPGNGPGDKKEIKGTSDVAYRLRVGNYRVFYRINSNEHVVYVFDVLTAEQAHKKYGRL